MEALFAMNPIKVGLDDMLYGITHWAAHILILANTRPHQLCWGDQKMGSAISCRKCSQVAW